MTLEQAKALKVGDIVRYKNPHTETLEIVTEAWVRSKSKYDIISIRLSTLAVLLDKRKECDIGDKGWINDLNCWHFEKIG